MATAKVNRPKPPEPTITAELSLGEAEVLSSLLGNLCGGSPIAAFNTSDLYDTLSDAVESAGGDAGRYYADGSVLRQHSPFV